MERQSRAGQTRPLVLSLFGMWSFTIVACRSACSARRRSHKRYARTIGRNRGHLAYEGARACAARV